MNDNIFGQQGTDEIIIYRRNLLSRYLRAEGLEELEQDYSRGFFKAREEDRGRLQSKLEPIAAKLKEDLGEFIFERAQDVRRITSEKKDAEKLKKIDEFIDHLKKHGYRMTFGISTVEGRDKDGDYSNIEVALAQGLEMAERARGGKDSYGEEFDEVAIIKELKELAALREMIINQYGNQVTDQDGLVVALFTQTPEGLWEMNRDIIRVVRKYEFKDSYKGKPGAIDAISLYVRKLNLFDIVKPFTHEEFIGKKQIPGRETIVADEFGRQKDIARKLRAGNLSAAEAREAAAFLDRNPKDALCTSRERFLAEAMKIKDCSYILLDRVDLGVDLAQSYERLSQEVLQKIHGLEPWEVGKIFREASVSAGDDTTEAMRELRKMVYEEFKNAFPDENFVSLVGGDELTFVLDNNRVPQKKLDAFLINIQKKTKSRLVRSVETKRSSKKLEGVALEEHHNALKRAETGAEVAKDIEVGMSRLRSQLRNKLRGYTIQEGLGVKAKRIVQGGIDEELDKILSRLDLSNYIIIEDIRENENRDKINFVFKSESGVRDPQIVLRQIGEILKKIPDKDTLDLEEVEEFIKSI
jgi:hypothetical protein